LAIEINQYVIRRTYGRQGFQSNPNGYGSPPGGAGYGGDSYGVALPAVLVMVAEALATEVEAHAPPQPGAYSATRYQVCAFWKYIYL
jgi:hypothetical protein